MRFDVIYKTVWLVGRRFGLQRDMRRLLIEWVKANIFRWETELLRYERLQTSADFIRDHTTGSKRFFAMKLRGSIILHVEECEPLSGEPNDPADEVLALTRIKAKRLLYAPIDWFWIRLRPR